MRKNYFLLILTLLLTTASFAQNGKISGRIFNDKNEPVQGVSIKVTGLSGGVTSDIEGRYILSIPEGKKYEIQFSAVGYENKVVTEVESIKGQLTTLDIILELKSKNLDNVVVSATRSSARKESVNALIQFQKNTNTVAAVISAESIRKSPDRNTGEVLKRISGASIQDGKYLIVRGLADRYNQATLNGALMSSTEPDRKTFSFDIFPSAIIDNIIINKAATPEMPGEFAGGLVQINTKDVPTENFFTVQAGTGINLQTNGKDFYTYKGGKTDWLGIDDGIRKLPADFPATAAFYNALSPTEQADLSRKFTNVWMLNSGNAPLNINGQLTGGFNKAIGKGKLGAIFSLNYNKNNRRTETFRMDQNNDNSLNYEYDDNKYNSNVLWGALGNITYQFSKSKFSWKNLFNVNSNNYGTIRTGNDRNADTDIKGYELGFSSTKLYSTQLSAEHNLSLLKGIKLKYGGSYSYLDQQIPDLRRLFYAASTGTQDYTANVPISSSGSSTSSGRFFSELTDNIYGSNVDIAKPFNLFGEKQTVKIGYLFQAKHRLFNPRIMGYVAPDYNNVKDLIKLAPNEIFAPANINAFQFRLSDITNPEDRYRAYGYLNAGYVQFDNQFSNKIKASWGVRYEHYDQELRWTTNSGKKKNQTIVSDFLPSANVTYALNNKTNIRVCGSQTVVRPEFRELSEFSFYNFDLLVVERGNPLLQRTKVTNADLRYEIYPKAGELITIGAFYKYFNNPIEKYYNSTGGGSQSLTFKNAPNATSSGIELEFRKSLGFIAVKKENAGVWSNLTLFGNIAYIYNRVQFNKGQILKSRPMQGQSDYVVNGGLQYESEKSGTNFSMLVNRIGRRIFIVGDQDTKLDTWEAPRTLLDFQITQKIIKNLEVKLSASDLLNQYAVFYEDVDDNGKYNASKDQLNFKSRYGTNLSLSVSYKF